MKNNLVLCFKVLSLTKKVCQKLLKLPSKKKKKYISLQKIISSTDDRFDSTRLEKRTSYSWNPYETTQHLGLRSNAMIRKKKRLLSSILSLDEKFLPGHYNRKNVHFQEVYSYQYI